MNIEKLTDYMWIIPRHGDMRVDGVIYSSEDMLRKIKGDGSLEQVANVATLPGIVLHSLAMPDIHSGYGFPIGGVAAFDAKDGIISPGGVGYDINCGVRLIRTELLTNAVRPKVKELVDALFLDIPAGVGSIRRDLKLSKEDLDQILRHGASYAIELGFGTSKDLEFIEAHGAIAAADPTLVSNEAKNRGVNQLGTLGSGNHFVEIQEVAEVFDPHIANIMGLFEGQVVITIHTGSRGLGYQVCDDYINIMKKAAVRYHISIPDKQLACAPLNSAEGQEYLAAMAAAANFAFANRQLITHLVRRVFENTFQMPPRDLYMDTIYDVCHNIAKFEEHKVGRTSRRVCVHRKGATRAFPAHHPEIPAKYREIGQPVIVPGDMGRASYVLVGTDAAMDNTFGSTSHGAGRIMSRHEAKRSFRGRHIEDELGAKGIIVKGASRDTIIEEAPESYKDVENVVDTLVNAQIAKKVARLKPMGVIKG